MFKNFDGNLVYFQKTLVIRICFETAVSPHFLRNNCNGGYIYGVFAPNGIKNGPKRASKGLPKMEVRNLTHHNKLAFVAERRECCLVLYRRLT